MARVQGRPSIQARGAAAVLGLAGLVVLATAHGLGQYTAAGRHFGGTAQEALIDRSWRVLDLIRAALAIVTVPSLAAVLAVLVAVAVLRRRWWSAVAVVVLIGGANVSTQLLKYRLLELPDTTQYDNSLPSGHATVACSVGLALLFVTPGRWRGPVAGVAVLLGTTGGLATLWGGTHRPVDVAGATGVCAVWAAVAALIAGRDRRTELDLPATPRPSGPAMPGRPGSAIPGRSGPVGPGPCGPVGPGSSGPADRVPNEPLGPGLAVLGWAVAGALTPAGVLLGRLAQVRPGGATQAAVTVIVLVALVAATVSLTALSVSDSPRRAAPRG